MIQKARGLQLTFGSEALLVARIYILLSNFSQTFGLHASTCSRVVELSCHGFETFQEARAYKCTGF